MATPTIERFASFFKEFQSAVDASPDMVQAHLDAALPCISESYFEGAYEMCVYYQTAHSLSLSPFGTQAALKDAPGETVYSAALKVHRSRLSARMLQP